MDLNEIKINESNKKLDSFIFSLEKKLIDDRHLIAILNEIKFTEVSQKRTGRKLSVPDFEGVQTCLIVSEYIGTATITKNIDIIKAVEELKIGALLEWFTEAEVLRNEFNKINSSAHFRILPFEPFNDILYLNKAKVLLILINHYWPSWKNSRHRNLFADTLVNMEETKKSRIRDGKLPFSVKDEQETDEKIAKLKADFENTGINQNYKDLLNGNIVSPFVQYIFNQIRSINEVSNRQKKLVIFPLLKLILKDIYLQSEEDFYSYNSKLPNYEEYMVSAVNNLLNLK